MIQISKERLYEIALESINSEVNHVYDLVDDNKIDRWLLDSIATIGGITNFTAKIVNEGEVKDNE